MLQSNTNLEKIKKWLTKKIVEKLKFELKEKGENYKKRMELLREEVNDLKFKNSKTVTIGPLTNKKM